MSPGMQRTRSAVRSDGESAAESAVLGLGPAAEARAADQTVHYDHPSAVSITRPHLGQVETRYWAPPSTRGTSTPPGRCRWGPG